MMQAPVIKQEKTDDEDDEVVQELPVYLSKGLAGKLWVLQYPIRPADMTYDNAHYLEAKVKPSQKQLRLTMEINTNSASYDASKGEQIALNVDGSRLTRDETDLYYGSSVMDRQSLGSQLVTPDARRYCLGVIADGEVHLCPVDAVLAMKPSFDYLDRGDKKGRQEARELGQDLSGDEEEAETPAAAEKVQVKFSRPESDRLKAAREKSYHFLKQKEAAQPWLPATVHKKNSAQSESEWQKLLCSRTDDLSLTATVDSAEYRARLVPTESSSGQQTKQSLERDRQMPLRELRLLPVADQVRALMVRMQIVQFSSLLPLLPKGTPPSDVVRVLQQCALLVKGLWVVRSDVLWPTPTGAAASQQSAREARKAGVSPAVLARGRDYMLYQWTQRTFVSRQHLAERTRLPDEQLTSLLEPLAELVHRKGWRLKLKPDPSFERAHAEVVQRQQMLWEAKHQQMLSSFGAGAGSAGGGAEKPRRRRQRSQRHSSCSVSSDNEATSGGGDGGRQKRAPPLPAAVKVKQERLSSQEEDGGKPMDAS